MRNGLIRLSGPAIGRAALCVAACFGAASTAAAPTLPKVVTGQATFSQDGNVFSITNTPGTIINWQSFSVDAGEITRFIQQNSDSAVMNRIVGQDPSRILGALQSNGKVFLINPNGVVFGQGARVDVGGLVASTLNISDADFLAGKKNFSAGPTAGAVRNEGAITTPSGGKVFLVAPNVENAGIITAPNGEVVLAAGRSVQLVDSANPDLTVVVSAPGDQAINLGQVVANGGRIGIYGALVNQRGALNATGAVAGQDGRIFLKASKDIAFEQGSVTANSLRAQAGQDLVVGAAITANGGSIDLRAENGISLNAGGALNSADYIDLKAERMTLAGMIGGVGGVNPVVSFNSFRNGTPILVQGSQADGALTLDPSRLGAFNAYGINIGNSGHAGQVAINGALSLGGNLLIDTSGSIDINAAVLLTGATGQFLATQHAGGGFRVGSGGAIAGARKIGVAGASLVAIGGQLGAGEIDLAAGSGGIALTGNLGAGSRVTLRTAGELQGTAAVKTPALLVEANSVNLMGNNEIGTIAGAATDAGLRLRWTGELRIGSVGERTGLAAHTDLTLTGGALVVDATASAPNALVVEAASIKGEGTLASNVLSLTSGGGIGEASRPLRTSTATLLNARNTAAGSAPINIVNDRALVVGNVAQEALSGAVNGGAVSIESTGGLTVNGAVRTGSGDIRLVTHSPLTINGTVTTDSGNVTLLADNKGLLTIGANGQVKSTSGSVQITAGDTLIPENGIVAAPGKLTVTKTNAPQDPQPGLPPQLDLCLANPATTACGPVIEQATRACIANPEAEQCGRVLPPPQSCRENPDRLGCGVSLVKECIATPKAPSCAGVLPPYETCEKTPGTYGCAPVIQDHNAVTACIATPKAPGCGEVLPPLATCRVDAGVYGCVPVLDRAEFLACVANPLGAGCAARLPSLSVCKATPGIEGCAQVLKLGFDACLINQNDPSCNGILPTVSQCVANKAMAGCEVVLPTLQQCVASPALQGCSVQLPTLAQCVANKATAGCDAVLPTLQQCVASPALQGCAVQLPSLAQCVANKAAAGCAVVLPTLQQCVASPALQGCSVMLPTLAQCVADKATAGCAVVLPTLQQCVASPSLQGCAVMLPTLAQCAANPALAGCQAVLPNADFCSTHPGDAACVVFNPGAGQAGDARKPVATAVQNTVTLMNTKTPSQDKLPPPPTGQVGNNASANNAGGSGEGGGAAPPEQSESQAGPAQSTNSGAKNEKPATKMYCN